MTPDKRELIEMEQVHEHSNSEGGIPSGSAAEFQESSLIESMMIDSVISVRINSSA